MPDSPLHIPEIPETGWRIFSRIFPVSLLLIGVFLFEQWDLFAFIWSSFIGAIVFAQCFTSSTQVIGEPRIFIKTRYFLWLIAVGGKRYPVANVAHIERRISKASGYDDKGMYRPSLLLKMRDGEEVCIQLFCDIGTQIHPTSLAWATRLSQATGLPVVERIETW